ncbi:transcription elongation factor SPT4 [Hymenopellis radicata]|nr:transcription elongation factor SPT4 [Hymenopellis radicata]KAF9032677.1 transcription elongation factor SPT4 [Hymenopellis radicata]
MPHEKEVPEVIPMPKNRNNRACLLCSIIQTSGDFRANGCPNCENVLHLEGNPERILSCTSQYFDGMIAMITPEKSWVAKWQRTSTFVRGIYAVRVKGRIPEDIEAELRDQDVTYRPRDLTAAEQD